MSTRCLFLSPCTPRPHGTGWEQRAYSFLCAYARVAEVEAWCLPTDDAPELDGFDAAREVARVRRLTTEHTRAPGWLEEVRSAARASDFVHVTRGDLPRALRLPRVLWDLDELPWFEREPSPVARERVRDQLEATAQHAERVYVSSPLELDRSFPHMAVIPNVVQTAARDGYPPDHASTLLFVGNFNYAPNLDAVQFFVGGVWKAIRARAPAARLVLAGRSPKGEMRQRARGLLVPGDGIEVTLDPPDIQPLYRLATATVAPLRIGGGTRLKIIESFAQRCPVVATSFGCAGLELEAGTHLLVADSEEALGDACLRLLDDGALRRALVDTAFARYEERHTQAAVDRLIAEELRNLR